MGENRDIKDPELSPNSDSEIEAAVDISTYGLDGIWRPIFIGQDQSVLVLTPEDAKRLQKFLKDAINFVDEFQTRSVN